MDPNKPPDEGGSGKEMKEWVECSLDSLIFSKFPDAVVGEWMNRFGDYIFRFLNIIYQTPSTPEDCEKRKTMFQRLLEEQGK